MIVRPSCLIRIKAPHQMGKTWLINWIIDRAIKQGYRTVYLSFQLAEKEVFTNLDKFLRWFCVNITQQLEYIKYQEITLEEFLHIALTENGIYSDHLR